MILTCTVELSPSVDVPVTVNTVWTGPAGLMSSRVAQPVHGSTTLYRSFTVVTSFGIDQSGEYTCSATITLSLPSAFVRDSVANSSLTVTVGEKQK